MVNKSTECKNVPHSNDWRGIPVAGHYILNKTNKKQMKMDKQSEIKIMESTNYEKFGFIKGNRKVNTNKVQKIIRSIESGIDFLPYVPIVVDSDYNIIDGQHRYEVCKKLKIPVRYVMNGGKKIAEIASINCNTDKWTMTEFMNCYIELGLDEYKYIYQFWKQHGLSLSITISILYWNFQFYNTDGDKNRIPSEAFKEGTFKCADKKISIDIASRLNRLLKYTTNKKMSRGLATVLIDLMRKDVFDFEKLIHKLDLSGQKIDSVGTNKHLRRQIEEVYNYRNQHIVRLF